jgi:OOP family OmpA-OmpF porin
MNSRLRLNKSALAALLVFAGIGAAHAEGVYVGGSVGSPDFRSSVGGINGDSNGAAVTLFGGYQFTPHLAVEGGAFSLGHVADINGKAKLRGAYVDAVGRYEFAPKFAVLGSAGLAEGHFTTTQGDDNSPALKLGAGLEYTVAPQVALRAQYDHYHFTDAFDSKPNVGAMSVGVKVGF